MNNKEEAELKWAKIAPLNSIAPMSYLNGISDFKAALIQAVKKESKERVIDEKDASDYLVFSANDIIELINETKPL